MKRILMIIFLVIFSANSVFAETLKVSDMTIFTSSNKKYYGLKDKSGKEIIKANYKKLLRLGENAWIFQKKNNKFGLMDCQGNILVLPHYKTAERMYDNLAKLGDYKFYGVFDEYGNVILPPEFTVVEPMFGKRFLTCKNSKYGVYSIKGEEILANKYDFIFMPNPRTVRIKYNGNWFEINSKELENYTQSSDNIDLEDFDNKLKIFQIVANTGIGAGYGVVTATDYTLKIFSSISLAYEKTIDELLFSKGVDTVPDIMRFSWIPKFPVVYAKNYYDTVFEPDNSPLSGVRSDLLDHLK